MARSASDEASRSPWRPGALVWVDARGAVIVRLDGERPELERLESAVPSHRRSTGHVRHDPAVRHGGGGSPQTAGEPGRQEHRSQFIEAIAARLPADDLLILGPGTVREHLERHIRDSDERHGRSRTIRCEPAAPLTDPQLVARLRHEAGVDPRRRRPTGV